MDTSIPQATIDEVKAAHPGVELHLLSATLDDGTVYEVLARAPSAGDWNRFRSMMTDDAQRSIAQRTLTCSCVLYPAPAEFQALLQMRPGLGDTFSSDLADLAGITKAVTRKKV